MFAKLKDLFSTDDKRLRASVLTTQVITVAVKSPVYHEIVPDAAGYAVRVYDRKTSTLMAEDFETTLDAAKRSALALVNKYNEGGK